MQLLADWELDCDGTQRRIELYWGDLSYLEPEHAVDILVVSAFRNDYMPTPGSLIGALHRNGISVYRLSFAKDVDMRDEFGCWLSQQVGVNSFKRLLCIESGWMGSPPELADHLFRALVPISLSRVPTRTVAMPLIGAGDQGYSADRIMEAVLRAAVSWLRRGIPVEVLKIVAYADDTAGLAKRRFLEIREEGGDLRQDGSDWDVFVSYSSDDAGVATDIQRSLESSVAGIRVFRDKPALEKGASWLMQLAEAIDSSRCFMALYTPSYWQSVFCRDELSAAYVRQANADVKLLYPVYYRESSIPSFFEALHYADCREADQNKLAEVCREITASL